MSALISPKISNARMIWRRPLLACTLVLLALPGAVWAQLTFPTSGYTTLITDPADPALEPCRDILSVGYQQDGVNAFFSITVNCSEIGFNNQRYFIFLDPDNDGDNDFLLWMDNPQKVQLFEWQPGSVCTGGASWVDTFSPSADFADPNLVPDNTIYLGVALAEIGAGENQVIGASTATSNVKVDYCCNDAACMGSGDSTGPGEAGVAFLTIQPATVCAGVSSTVTANRTDTRAAFATFTWFDASDTLRYTDAGVAFVSGVAASAYTPPDSSGFWRIHAEYADSLLAPLPDSLSPESDDIFLQVQGPTANAGSAATVCAGGSTTLGGSPAAIGGAGPYSFAWSPTAGLDDATLANPLATPASTQTYTLTVTDANGCTATSSVTVTVNSPPVADAGADTTICLSDSVVLGGAPTASGTGPFSYVWSPAADLDDPSAANPAATPSGATVYSVTVTDANGCTASSTVSVGTAACYPDLRRGQNPATDAPGAVAQPNFHSGGNFPQETSDLTPGAPNLVFYTISAPVDTLRVAVSGGRLVITY